MSEFIQGEKIAEYTLSKYLARYPKPASDYEAGARYDSVYIIANAIKSCKKVDTDCINNYLYEMPDYDGVIGKYHFDKNGDPVGLKTFAVKIIKDAEKEIIEEIE